MEVSDPFKSESSGHVVYTVGLAKKKPEEIRRVVETHNVRHVVDVRSEGQQRAPASLRPDRLDELCSSAGAKYVNLSAKLGDRPDYHLFALSSEFADVMEHLSLLVSGGSMLLVCSETDYRRCHRKVIASYLARRGFRVRHFGKALPAEAQLTLEASLVHRPRSRRMFTIGFTKKSMREFVELLRAAKVKRLVDIRLRPTSQYSGFAKKADLEFLLELLGIEYIHATGLAPTGDLLDEYRKDGDWARYARDFQAMLEEREPDILLGKLLEPGMNVAFLCTEDMPHRCHRSLVSEYARNLFQDLEVVHLTSQGMLRSGFPPERRQSN